VESDSSCEHTGMEFSPVVMETWGGVQGEGKGLEKTKFTKVKADLDPALRPHAVGHGSRCVMAWGCSWPGLWRGIFTRGLLCLLSHRGVRSPQ